MNAIIKEKILDKRSHSLELGKHHVVAEDGYVLNIEGEEMQSQIDGLDDKSAEKGTNY